MKKKTKLRARTGAVQCRSPRRPPNVAVLAGRHCLAQAQLGSMTAALSSKGCTTVVLEPESACYERSDDTCLMPRTRVGSPQELADRIPIQDFPLILKAVFRDKGNGLRVLQIPEQLERMMWPENMELAQKFLGDDGYDRKLYCIGEEVCLAQKPRRCSRSSQEL